MGHALDAWRGRGCRVGVERASGWGGLRWGIENDSKDGEGERNGRRARCRDAFMLGVLTRENGRSGAGFKMVRDGQPGSGDPGSQSHEATLHGFFGSDLPTGVFWGKAHRVTCERNRLLLLVAIDVASTPCQPMSTPDPPLEPKTLQ